MVQDCFWNKPFVTSLPLYLTTSPFGFNFTLYTYLTTIAFLPISSGVSLQLWFFSIVSPSLLPQSSLVPSHLQLGLVSLERLHSHLILMELVSFFEVFFHYEFLILVVVHHCLSSWIVISIIPIRVPSFINLQVCTKHHAESDYCTLDALVEWYPSKIKFSSL